MSTRALHTPLEAAHWPVKRCWSRLDELCLGIWDCPHSTPMLAERGPFVVRSQDIRSGIFRLDESARVSEATYLKRIARAEPEPGDLLYSREGTYFGIAAEMPQGERVCLGQRMVLIRPDSSKLNSRFLRLWLNSPALARHIHGFRDGTVAERLNMPTIRGLPVPIFEKEQQDQIAELLGAFDDKIELNRRMNETLEAMAQAIFRDWFVDFGPTRAKMEGRAPYLAPHIWPHFPDTLDQEGVPAGWSVRPVSDFFELNPKETLKKGMLAPYLEMAALPTVGPVPQPSEYRPYTSGPKFRDGDTLFARITPCLENGKTAYVFDLGEGAIGAGSTEFIVLRARQPVPSTTGYLLARDPSFRLYAQQSMTGTSGRQRASAEALGRFQITVPKSKPIWGMLDQVLTPSMNGIICNARESRTLAELRDLLLPKLMSGEIRLRDAERAVEAVA